MSDPDDPSSNRLTKQEAPPGWDKGTAVLGSNSAATPSRSSSNDSSGKNGGSLQPAATEAAPPPPGKRERLRRKFRRPRRKHHNDDDGFVAGNVMSEKSGAPRDAPDISPAPDGASALDDGDGEGTGKRHPLVRFLLTIKEILFSSYVNLLLIFVPIGIIVHAIGLKAEIVFAMNAIAIIPLAGLLAYATEVVALSLGDTLGALLNVSFGNAVELIIFIIALVKNEINIVQASLIGSILSNLLLILGMAFLFGGLRFQEQLYNSTVTQMSACLLSLAVTSLLLPTVFHASFSDTSLADTAVLKLSRGTSVILLIVYILYLLFQLKSHSYMYASTPQHVIDEEMRPGVLTEFLNTSSSSSSDDDDDDSSSSSSGSDESHHTAKVIKRALKGRRRRKSNGSTTGSPSIKSKKSRYSFLNSGSNERPIVAMPQDSSSRNFSPPTGPPSPDGSTAIASGDEADTDGEGGAAVRKAKSFEAGLVHHRDFGLDPVPVATAQGRSTGDGYFGADASQRSVTFDAKRPKPVRTLSDKERKAAEKARRKEEKAEKKEKKHGHKKTAQMAAADTPSAAGVEMPTIEEIKPAPPQQQPRSEAMVRHASSPGENVRRDVHFAEGLSDTPRISTSGRRPLASLPIRPQLPKMLSQTVFSREYNAQTLARAATNTTPRVPYGLRRTSSLPEQLNRANSVVGRKNSTTFASLGARMDGDAQEVAETSEKVDLKHRMPQWGAVMLLLCSTALVAVCAEFLVDSINGLIADSSVTEAFIGLIILPIVGNAAEHVTAVTMASKNKMDLAIGIAVGSSIQIAIFVTPIVVLLGWIMQKGMSLYFTLFETVSLFASAFIVNFLVLDGRSNYLEGSLLIAAYTIIAVAAFFYPDCDASSGAKCMSGMAGGA